MAHFRNPRLSRILEAMETKKISVNTANPKEIISMDDLDNNVSRDANPIYTCKSPSLLQEQMLPPSLVYASQTMEAESYAHPIEDDMPNPHLSGTGEVTLEDVIVPGLSSRARSHSTSSESSSSSSSTSSSSSSSTNASKSGKDFSPEDADCDPDYIPKTSPRRITFSPTPESSFPAPPVEEDNLNPPKENRSPIKRRRKGTIRNLSVKQNAKRLRNSGQEYQSVSKLKKVMPKKKIGPPCGQKCRLKCSETIKQEDRQIIFNNYWEMGDLSRQRDYIAKCIDVIKPRYQYKMHNNNRGPKHSFSFEINTFKQRVCKVFFRNTLAINNRPIATTIAKKNNAGTVEAEKRGKHGKQYKISSDIISGIKKHIDTIPRIESHYLRQQTTREFIDGGKSITDLYTDYQTKCLNDGVEAAKIHTYRRVFNEDYNIGFHTPKKDQCELCVSFKNAVDKLVLQTRYDQHLLEKELCRQEKSNDKTMVQENHIVACYDLQAVLPLPKGDVSSLYYKCKLNVYNFTVSELAKDYCDCFVWSEVDALRGANEIATCVWRYLTKRASEINDDNLQITFYSDNCCGQQKNKFMYSMYVYALTVLKIKSITHKYLITGHTQNENDSVHSVIEKAVKRCLRSGPLYTPDQYVTIIRTARKKGNPYNVTEMCYSDFVDIKNLTETCGGQFSKDTEGKTVKMSDIKVIKFEKNQSLNHIDIFYKTSYLDTDFKEIKFLNNRSSRTRIITNLQNFQLKPLYQSRLKLTDRKNSDLKSLIASNIIPQSYALSYYNNILF